MKIITEQVSSLNNKRTELCNTFKQRIGQNAFLQKYPGDCNEWISKNFKSIDSTIKTFENQNKFVDVQNRPNPIFRGTINEFFVLYACDLFPSSQYCKTDQSSNTSESWPEKFKCVTSGQLREDSQGIPYYTLDIDDTQYFFEKTGYATKADPELWNLKYKCENNKPIFYSPCSVDGRIVPGKDTDPWEYKKSVDPDDSNKLMYCVKKKTSSNWIFLSPKNPKMDKALKSVEKFFSTVGSDEGSVPPRPSGTETPSPTPTLEPPKYPQPAPTNIVDQFKSKFPCLDSLKTYVNVDKDGDEYYYKVERTSFDEKVFYFLNGICQIKREDGTKEKKYFHCPKTT